MVVRNKMCQAEPSETGIPAAVLVARPVPIDRGSDDIDSLRERIQAGRAYLEIVEYPWGVEFEVGDAEGAP